VTFACQREVNGISRRAIFRKSAILSPTTRMAESDIRVPKGGCRHQPKNSFPKECDSCVTASRICTRMMPLPNNDGVHRVAAGGCSKNKKPAGRNSGATLCYTGNEQKTRQTRKTLVPLPHTCLHSTVQDPKPDAAPHSFSQNIGSLFFGLNSSCVFCIYDAHRSSQQSDEFLADDLTSRVPFDSFRFLVSNRSADGLVVGVNE
jgi:hypothetical protein